MAASTPPTRRATGAPVSSPAAFTRGAVDLSTYRQAGADPAVAGNGAPPPGAGTFPPGSFTRAVTEADFQTAVLDQSMTVPVVLDLWATWCEPCKQLSPLLERVADSYGGRFVLATLDVDAEQRIAAALQVQSIPTVIGVLKGQLVPLFQGAVPEEQVREVIGELLRVAEANGVAATAAPAPTPESTDPDAEPEPEPEDPRFLEAAARVDAGDYDAAGAIFRQVLAAEPDNTDARLGLAEVDLLARTAGVDPAVVQARADADPGDLEAGLAAADAGLLAGEVEAAFARLVALVRRSSGADRDAVRARLVQLFELVGPADPRVVAARVALANALF